MASLLYRYQECHGLITETTTCPMLLTTSVTSDDTTNLLGFLTTPLFRSGITLKTAMSTDRASSLLRLLTSNPKKKTFWTTSGSRSGECTHQPRKSSYFRNANA